MHGHVYPTGVKNPLIADQKNLVTAETPGAWADLVQKPSAKNDLRHFKFVVMKTSLHVFHIYPFSGMKTR